MFEPILANYTPDGDDWTVAVTCRDKTMTATAPGLIAARDRADQLVEQLAPGERNRTVVHTLDGDAVGFTAAYMTARLARPEREPIAAAAEAAADKDAVGPARGADLAGPSA
ncbi:hypothetical protein [Actinokineospora sp.]|uniref:hypothetical protein n=1 Tax=Actinokineospora sp. TaxID=1872133 RepID=UPI004037A4A9